MRVEGEQSYAAGREVIWSLLIDPITLKQLLPGCDSLEVVSSDEYHGRLSIRVGQIAEQFSGTLRLEQMIPGHSFTFRAEGQNPDGAVNASGRISLHSEGVEMTRLAYEADFGATGRPAQVSERLLLTTARSFARRCLEALHHQVDIRTRTYTTTTDRPERTLAPSVNTDDPGHLVIRRRVMGVLSILLLLLVWRSIDRRRTPLFSGPVAEGLDQTADVTLSRVSNHSTDLLRVDS